MNYAAGTSVSTEKSRVEIERTLTRYGADSFGYGWDADRALIEFVKNGMRVRLLVPLPPRDSRAFTHHSRGQRTPAAAAEAWEQACRQRWRALALVVKAKLEAVEAGITTFESEFLGHIVLPSGGTVSDELVPRLTELATGNPVTSLLALPRGSE